MDKQFQLLLGFVSESVQGRPNRFGESRMGAYNDQQLLEDFYFNLTCYNRTKTTIRYYAVNLRYLAGYLKMVGKTLSTAEQIDLKRYVLMMLENKRLSPHSINSAIRAFRRFYSYIYKAGLIKENPAIEISQIKAENKVREILTGKQLELLLKSFKHADYLGQGDPDFYVRRNRSLILLMFDTGARIGEVCGIKLRDLELKDRLVKVIGKTRTERFVPFSEKVALTLHRYINRARHDKAGEWLFCSNTGEPCTPDSIRRLLTRKAKRLGFKVHPHLFRHTFITNALIAGMSEEMVRRIVGQSSPIVMSRYVHVKNSQMVEYHNRYSPVNNIGHSVIFN